MRVDGEYKVDVGWLRVLQAKSRCRLRVVVQCMERTRGRGGRVTEVVEQFPNSVQNVFRGGTRTVAAYKRAASKHQIKHLEQR